MKYWEVLEANKAKTPRVHVFEKFSKSDIFKNIFKHIHTSTTVTFA